MKTRLETNITHTFLNVFYASSILFCTLLHIFTRQIRKLFLISPNEDKNPGCVARTKLKAIQIRKLLELYRTISMEVQKRQKLLSETKTAVKKLKSVIADLKTE